MLLPAVCQNVLQGAGHSHPHQLPKEAETLLMTAILGCMLPRPAILDSPTQIVLHAVGQDI